MYVKNGCEKITSEMFYSCMLQQLEKFYQRYRCTCLISLLEPQLPLICRSSIKKEGFLNFICEKSIKHFGLCKKLAKKTEKKNFLKFY